jgi:LysM repeat protein
MTAPGLGHDEGVFLVTAADDGGRAIYFIAKNLRHSISIADLQLEQQLNPLWPVRYANREDVLAFAEGTPVANARTGLLDASVAAAPSTPVEDAPAAPEAAAQAPIAQDPTVPMGVEPSTYLVRPGDNLTHIARDHATTIDAILAANGISNANRVYAGLTLVIPGTASADDMAEPEPAAVAAIVESEAVADMPEGAEATTYMVKPGDSAILIARQFDVDVDLLLTANGVVNRDRVYTGQTLTIPAGA